MTPQDAPAVLVEALAAIERGWPVLPVHGIRGGACTCSKGAKCKDTGKHPRTKNGLKDARAEEGTIREWWREWSEANLGIRTGETSRLVVLDVAPRHGGDATLVRLTDDHSPLPYTIRQVTGSGGKHVFFQHPWRHIRNNQNGKMGPGHPPGRSS